MSASKPHLTLPTLLSGVIANGRVAIFILADLYLNVY